jgi:hypothetical protein
VISLICCVRYYPCAFGLSVCLSFLLFSFIFLPFLTFSYLFLFFSFLFFSFLFCFPPAAAASILPTPTNEDHHVMQSHTRRPSVCKTQRASQYRTWYIYGNGVEKVQGHPPETVTHMALFNLTILAFLFAIRRPLPVPSP